MTKADEAIRNKNLYASGTMTAEVMGGCIGRMKRGRGGVQMKKKKGIQWNLRANVVKQKGG